MNKINNIYHASNLPKNDVAVEQTRVDILARLHVIDP